MAEDKTYKPNLTLNIDKDGRVTLDDAFARRLAEEEQKEEERKESIRARASERAAAGGKDAASDKNEPLTPQAAPRYEGSDVQRAVEGAAQNRVQNATEKKTDIVSVPDATQVNRTDVEEAVPKDRTTMLAGKMGERIRLKMHGDAEKWDREHPYKPETITAGNQSAPDFAQVRERAKGYYAHLTPDAANQYIQDVLHDSDFVAEVMDGAKEAGISEADYVRERLAPQIQQQVYEQLVEEHAPQSTLEYVMSGAMNSMIGQIFEASILPVEERNLRQAGREQYAADAGELAKLGNMAAGVVSDLPVFMVLGGTSGMLTKGLGMAATRNSTMQVASHLMREMATFGQYDALSSGVGQWYREGETDWRKVAAAAGKGTLSGAMMGVFGIGNNMLSRAYVSKYGFGPTWKYTFRGAPREIRSEEVGKWATDMAGRSAVLSVSSVLGQRMENPDFKWEDVNWGDEFKHALLLNAMLDLQGRVTGARRQQDGFEGGKLNADDIQDLQRAGMPVKTERQAYDYVVQTGRMGVLADRRLSMDQKQKMVDLLRLQDKEGKPLVLQVNPSTEARIGRTLDERWAVDEYDALGTLNMRRTFDTKEQAEAFAEKNSVWIDANKRAMLEATAESRRQTMANVESIRVVAEDNKCQPVEVASAVSKAMRGESLTKREKYLSDEVNAYADAYLKNVASLSETVAEETAGRYGHDPEWIEEAKRKDVADRSDDERAALRDYDVQLDEELNKRASAEETNGAVQGQEALDAGRTLYAEGDAESQRMQVIRTSVARERLVSVAGEEFARNLDEKGEAALYDYLYIPDEYMPLVDDYMRQKRTTEGMEDAMSERMKPAMDAAREIVGEMSPTTGADGQQEVRLVRDGEKTYVVRRQMGDVLMVTPISVNEDGTIDWSQYDGEVTRALKWKPQFSFERMNGEDIVREMVPEYTMERERIFGAPTEEEVLAVEAEGSPLQSSQIGGSPVGEMGTDGKNGSKGMIGRSLSEEEADDLILESTGSAESMPEMELTPENWEKEFGDGRVTTPLGEVKMGENQYEKLIEKGRQREFGMIKPTLTNPDFIIEEGSTAKDGTTERASSYLFVKSFIGRDGRKRYFFKSVTVKKDGMEVNVSNHIDSPKRVRESMKNGKLLYRKDGGAQTEQAPALTSVTTPQTNPGVSEGKGTENNPNAQGNAQENSERANLSAQWTEDGRLSDGYGGSVWAPREQTVEKLTEDMGGDRTAALRVVRNKSKQLRRELEESNKRLDEITDAKEYKAEWDRNLQLRESIEYWQEVDNSITDIQREAEMPEASRKMRSLMQQFAEALDVPLNVTDDMLYEMRRADKIHGNEYTEEDARNTNGFFTKDGGIVVNSRAVRGLSWAFGHETGHDLKQRDAAAYQRWKDAILGTMDSSQLREEINAKRNNERYKGNTEEELTDEIANDQIGEIMADPKKLESFVRQLNPNTLEHLWETTKKWLKGMDDVSFDDVLESAKKAGGKVLDDIRERVDVWRGFKEQLTETERILAEAYNSLTPAPSPGRGEDEGGDLAFSSESERKSFDEVYDQFKGKANDAVTFLLQKKSGRAIGALHHKDVGDIDLWYGNDNAGLKKIAEKHPEVVNDLQGLLENMHVATASDNRIILENDTHKAVVSKMLGQEKTGNWLLSAYEKKGISASSSDIETEPGGKQNGTAPLQNSLSEGKGTANISDVQGKGTENSSENSVLGNTTDTDETSARGKQNDTATLQNTVSTGISGGSIDIVPEPEGKQNGTAPLQNPRFEGKDTANISDVQGKRTENAIQGLEGYSESDVKDMIRSDVERKLEDAGLDVKIKDIALHGSRMRGDARKDSDLDAVVEYEGRASEDGLFNILNEEPLEIEGIKVDINPITRGKSGTMEQYMKRSRAYDEEVMSMRKEAEASGEGVKYSAETDPETLRRLENEETTTAYRAIRVDENGVYHSPMAGGGVGGAKKEERTDTYKPKDGEWEKADEHPELATYNEGDEYAHITIDKGEGNGTLQVAYNPYIHTSRQMLNDQFTSAWRRPDLQVLKVEVPVSELTSGYRAQYAKNAVGETEWNEGVVAKQLPEDKKRRVILTRWDKPVGIVPVEEYARAVKEQLEGTDVEGIPFNCVTPAQREALVKEGVKILEPEKKAGTKAREAYEDWLQNANDISFSAEISINKEKTSDDDLPIGKKFVSLQSERDREAVSGQRERFAPTAAWREGVDDVTVHTTLGTMRKKYGELHDRAKAGDVDAALELVDAVVKEDKVKALAEAHPDARVAFVHAEEATGRNALPRVYAGLFEKYGLTLSDIAQTNKPAHTGSDRVGRFFRRARFDGEVEPGQEYILVDDHVTMGGTLRDLKDYIESKGGKVVAVSTLTASAGSTKLRPTEEQIRQLNEKGITNEQLERAGIADNFDGLTRSEAREILVLADAGGDRGTSRGRETSDKRSGTLTTQVREDNLNAKQSSERIAPEEGEHFLDYAQRVAHIRRLAVDTNPSEAQKEAGNYKKGHLKVDGYDITIENPRGTTRSGKDADGKEWSVRMNYDYGYIRGTEGVDGDHIDVYLSEKPEEGNVYVVDQIDQKTGKFDEHKVMYGFPSEDAAREAYLSQYEDGWKIGPVTEVSREQFKKWIESSHRKTKPFSEYKSLKASPLTPLRGEGENEDVRFSAEMRSRDAVPKVRGGWTERKILNYLKKNPTRSGVRSASRAIAEFESPAELKEHMFYHGTAWGSDKLKPSITMRDRDVERYGGGGYGEKYWGISLTKDKKIASRFSGTSSNVRIYPVVLLKDAKVVERPDFTDARDAEEHIAELWNDGVDAVWIGEGKEGKGEQELLVLNPRAVVNIGSPDFYRQYHLGLEDNPIRIADDAAIGNMYEMAKRFAAMKRPMRPSRPSKFETMPDGRLEWKNAEQYARETAEWQQRMKEWEESDEVKAYNEAEMEANRHVRFSAEHSGRQGTWKYLRKESLTRDNVPYFLYGMAGRYMEIMPKDSWGNKMLYRFEERDKEGKPHLNVLKAKEEANEVMPVLTQWRDELRAILGSDKATESAKTLLQSTVYDLDYALNWYDRVEAGDEDFYRTMDFPRFSAERDSRSAEDIARRDKEYAEAVAAGDKEKVDAMLREEAVAKGYNASSDYQGSIAFNGAAPSRNGYFETREERKKAFDEGDFEGDYSLGDFANVGLDNNDLEWQLTHPAAASAGHRPTLESIRNLNNAIKSKDGKIRMYRAVDAKVKENSFRNGDWVTPSREYAESHIQLQDWKKGRIIEQDVSIDDIWWNGDDINEWGYDDGRGTVYKNTANNRKLLEATYDDNGKLIPLSKRFNSRKADVRFSAEAPTFYSNAQRAVEGIRQEKATPEQWLAMIQKNGGLKAGEDKWLGLSDWLKSQKKSLSKQEVMDFIRENQIQIKEVKYAEDVDNSFDDEILEIWREAKGNNYDKADEVNRRLKEKYGDDFGKAAEVWYDGSLRVYNQTLLAKIKNGPDADTMPIEETRLNYTTKGLKNNREIALTVPTIESWNEHDEIHFGDAGEGRAVAWVRFGEIKTKDPIVKEQARAALNAFNKYMSDMMDKYKLVVWNQDALSDVEKSEFQRLYKAMKDAERNYDNSWERVLVIDEIQSKRHQEGREKGYKVSIERAEAEMEAFLKRMRDKYNYKPKDKWSEIFNEKEIEELDRLNGQLNDAYFDHGRVPDAPFEKNWHELAMKRMLRLAAEEGYDKLAWTTGNQQAERYNIGDKLSQLTICRNKHNPDQYAIIGYDVYGHTENNKVIEKDCTRDELADYIGKDLARQAIESTEYEDRNSDWDVLNITGEDLRLGGEGMKGFYDQMLPRFMDKYGKKWGVKTKNIELPEVEDAGRKMWAVDITPEMRESVMEGQPMFSAEGPTYYSNAQRAVEGIRQEKATPDQWRAMIEKAGGMKIGEDKWTGLSEWLKSSDKKSLTKQEVMDFIRENSIQVEEEWYADNNVEQNPRLRELRNEFDEIRLEMEGSRSTLEVELDDFTTKMYDKYGYGWHDKLNEEELAYEERFEELSSTEGTTDEKAFREMVDRYGDDFSEAFSVDLNGRLEPVMNWGGEISDAARYYLDISEKPINEVRLQYTTEGLENKREVVLTVPTIEPWNETDEIHFGDAGDGRAVAWVRFGDTIKKRPLTEEEKEIELAKLPTAEQWQKVDGSNFVNKHDVYYAPGENRFNHDVLFFNEDGRFYGELNSSSRISVQPFLSGYDSLEEAVNAYNRWKVNKMTKDEKILVIDEIQSKRHQEGREKGYRGRVNLSPATMDDLEIDRSGDLVAVKYKPVNERFMFTHDKSDAEILQAINETIDGGLMAEHLPRIPDAPFDKNWHELAMKRMLRLAAEEGYDKLAWTTGNQQAARYDIGQVIDQVSRSQTFGDTGETRFDLMPKDNSGGISLFVKDGKVTRSAQEEFEGKQLTDVVGKELAQKMLEMKDHSSLDIADMNLGGEGMRGFYDQILPRFMDKYGKKWGVKTKNIELPEVEDAGRKMWAVDITPEMRESVMEGQPMFSAEGTSPEWKKAAQELKRDADAMRRLSDLEQRDINEVAAGVLSRGGLLWADEGEGQYRKKGVKAMMGWSDGERRKFLGMFKTAENGGISVAEAGEAVEQACRDAGIRYDEEDPMAGVNAIQEVLGSVGSMSELTKYVERRRIDEAYSIAEENQAQEHDARDQWYREHYGMTYDEYEDWQESHASDGVVEKETESAKAQIDWLKRRNENQARQLERLQNKLDELKSMELGRPLVLAQDRIISSQQQEISAAKTEINRLKDEARYKKNYEKAYRELRDVKRQLAAYVRERMAAEDMPFTSKRELSKLLSTIEHTNTLEQMEEAITEVKIVSNRSRVHHLNYRLDRLMQMKVQGLNGRRMSVAKTVDDRTRRIIEDIRGRIEDLGITGMEEELDNLYRERRQTRTAINDAQKKGQTGEAETLETHWRELTEKIREKEDEIAQRRQESHGKGKLDIEDEISALEERYAQYAAGEKGVTWTDADADKITALFGMKVIEESKDNAHDVENIERSIRDKWNLLYQLREKRKDENLTGDEQRSIAGEMSRLKTEIDSERGLLADALSAEAESVERSINMMEELMDDGRNNLKKRVDAQLLHKMEVMKGAFSDVRKDGSEPNYDRGERTLKETPGIKIPVSCNIGSFEYMCKRISQSGVGGEDGWIYRYFIKGKNGVMKAFNTYQHGTEQQMQRLNEKVTEIFGKKNSRFFNTDAWTLQAAEADKVETHSGVSIVTEKDGVAERIELPMSKGAATYLYMVWKMDDGRMKMAKQGFDGQSMQEIEDFIGPRYKQLADWLQDEFLTESRARYNERYVDMYNTSMARIKNYVPLRVNRDATYRQSSLSDDSQRQVTLEQRAGSLINRTVNLTPVDITKSVFDVIGEHVDSMENWYAYSPVRRDLDAILSSTYFRNQLDINNAGHFKRFYDAAAVATQSYMPPAAEHGDKFMALMTRGLLSGNIAWRFATAIKQLYSGTAYLGYTYDPRFAGYLVKNLGTSLIGKNIRWCIENIPSYAHRADIGDVGNYRLQEKIGTGRMESAGQFLKKMGLVKAGEKVDNMRWEQVDRILRKYTQVGMLPNRFIDLFTCGLGAKTIYDYKYAELKSAIDRDATLTEDGRKNALEDAHRKAVMEADIFYNSTQQSSNPAFLSPMQVGRGALDRAFSAYQNNNLGYVRKTLGHALDLVRSLQYKRMVEAYKRMYVEQGMTERDAQAAARQQTLGLIGKSLLGMYIAGWLNKAAWDKGSSGFFGWGTDPVTDEDKKKENESDEAYKLRLQWDDMLGYLGGFARPIQGTPLGNILIDLSEMRGYNPLLAFDELNSLATDMTKIMREDGVFSREMLWALTNRALRTGGVNMETLGNIYFGVEQMMMDGGGWDEKMIDLMFILNTPNKGRMSAAKNLYKDASLEEYVAAVAKAEKYLKRGESLAQWFPSMKYAEGDKFKREFEKLQKEWNANHVDIASATKQEVDEIVKSADKRSLTDANKLYNQELNWDDIKEDSRISRMADVLGSDQQLLTSLKEKLKTAKEKNAGNEDRTDSARTIYNNLYEYRVKPMTQIKKQYNTYKKRVDKLKFQLDGGENDVPVMETIRQLRSEFLKELDAYEKYEAGAREKYPLKALDDMAD